jgi:exodeoxyribonuclease V gamma subunit
MLYLAETHSALLDEIARQLACTQEVRARHWFVFPRKGLREAALHQWARLSGIASHSQEVELRELIEQASGGGSSARFDVERLRWTIAAALPELQEQPHFPLPREASLSPMDSTVLASATQLARVVHETLQCRIRDEIWPEGSFLETLTHAPRVQDLLKTHPGLQTEAEFRASAQAWMGSWQSKGGFPHLWILLDAGLPAGLFRRLLELLQFLNENAPDRIHLFVMAPSRDYWADLAIKSHASRRTPRSTEIDGSPLPPGGMLWALGRSSQDLQRQLADTLLAVGDGGCDLDSPEPPDSLLGRLQASCRFAAPLAPEDRLKWDSSDSSLTVHAAHTALRELEVCRDRILQAFHEVEHLQHEEILILLANPREQAPLIEAALGTGSESRLPFRLVGGGGLVPSPFASTLLQLLQCLQGRLTLNEVQELLENPLIADRFDLNEADGDGPTLVEWLQDAQFRWGLTPDHRRQYQDIPESRWNLFWALRRLGLGGLVAEGQRDTILTGSENVPATVPLERTSGLGLALLARLARFATQLSEARNLWCGAGPKTLPEWNQALGTIVRQCLSTRIGHAAAHAAALQSDILEPLRRAADPSLQLEASAYLRVIAEKLPSLSDSGSRGTGGLTVADLRHYAGVPARVVVVAGLDDGVFPKSEDRPSWHPLVLKPATGDPSARDSDRHCLLLAILACRERLILSYRGCSDEDGKERPPSTALADLLEAVDQTIAPPEPQADPEVQTAQTAPKVTQAPLHESILFHHPLNGFSASAFGADLPHSARGMRSSDFYAAEALLNRKGFPAYPGPWSQSLPAETGWFPTLAELRNVLDQPQRLFASRLGLKLPEETETAPGEDLIDPNGLERWHLRDQLLTARLEGQSLESLVSVLHVSGRLPRGKIGDTVLQKAMAELPDLPVFSQNDRLTANLRFPLSDPDSNQSPWLLEGSPRARWYRRPGESAVFQFFASKPHSGSDYRRQLLFAFDALALAASQRDTEPHPLSEARCVGTQANWVLVLPPPIPARAHLGRLVRLARLARRWPLPFWPKTAGIAMKAGTPCPECPPDAQLKVLESAYSEWSSDPQDNSGHPDGLLPATRTLFRGCNNPFDWRPEGLPDWLPSSGTPLAWRLMVEIESWRNTLNLSTHE